MKLFLNIFIFCIVFLQSITINSQSVTASVESDSILIGKEQKIKEQIKKIGYDENFNIEIVNSKDTKKREKYVQYLFKKCVNHINLIILIVYLSELV